MRDYINAYFKRIRFKNIQMEKPSDALKRLHRLHTTSIPWENLDVYLKKEISLEIEDLFEKIIINNRGGYCFEVNTLFKFLLDQMGFNTYSVVGRPYTPDGKLLTWIHQMTIVKSEGAKWIADVGLGVNGWIEPLLLEIKQEQFQYGRLFRVIKDECGLMTVQKSVNGAFVNAVSFFDIPAIAEDFKMGNYYTSTHVESSFRNTIKCILHTTDGKISIYNNKFSILEKEKVFEKNIEYAELDEILREYFNIDINIEQRSIL